MPTAAGGHAGGHSFPGNGGPEPSWAMLSTHDAIVGYWDPAEEQARSQRCRPPPDDLDYLGQAGRGALFLTRLLRQFTPTADVPGAAVGGLCIARIEQPPLETLACQLVFLRSYGDLRADRNAEIVHQQHDLISFFGGAAFLNGSHRRRSMEVLDVTQRLAIALTAEIKHTAWSPRPVDFDARVYPMIQTPDHSTYPSGHATEAFALATVLHRLTTGQGAAAGVASGAVPFRIAHRISVNRTVAGVHFPVDSAAGALLGCVVGEALHALAVGARGVRCSFRPATSADDARDFGQFEDFTPDWLSNALTRLESIAAIPRDAIWSLAWSRAADEWPGSGEGPTNGRAAS